MINFTRSEYKKLIKNAIEANEGTIFINPQNPNKIIKTILEIPGVPEYLPIKMHTIKTLIKNKQILEELPIAIPQELVSIENQERGFQSDNIEGILLEDIIFNPRISLDFKINCFKQIGAILRKMSDIRKHTPLKNLFYNDMHEGNFIVTPDKIVYGIDPDSFSIEDNTPSAGFYSGELVDIIPYNCQKYKICEQKCIYSTEIIPDENLDIYCYIRMILNFMYGKEIDMLTNDKLLDYLDFLEFYGCNLELLDTIARIYDYSIDNINPDYLLDYIKDIYEYGNINHDKTRKLKNVLR